jgi:subtilisin family serine protease
MSDHEGPMGKRRLTGRKLVVLASGAHRASVTSALAGTNLDLVVAADYGGNVPTEVRDRSDVVLFDRLGTMFVARDSTDAATLISRLDAEGQVIAVEDEGYVYAIGAVGGPWAQSDYLSGYREGVRSLVDHLLVTPTRDAGAPHLTSRAARHATPRDAAPTPANSSACALPDPSAATSLGDDGPSPRVGGFDESVTTWGLQAIGAASSPFTGRGVKVAVLDTGYDKTHRDFTGRIIVAESLIAEEDINDWHGHGTHTAGTASGPLAPWIGPRYGVASGAELHICKVLDNCGVGRDNDVFNGINWALEKGCRVISMSLGAPTEKPLDSYTFIGKRAREQNALIIAAAGNDSRRALGRISPTQSPANAETILAVAAVDAEQKVADFSSGGKIEIAAPGVQIYSSYRCGGYRSLSGTSMAAPHVAGVAALLMEANPRMRAEEIWRLLLSSALRLDARREDVGAGLVQAPKGR